MKKYWSVLKNSFVIKSYSLYGDSLYRMSFTLETMGEKSGPVVSIRYRENSLYEDSFYGDSPVKRFIAPSNYVNIIQ